MLVARDAQNGAVLPYVSRNMISAGADFTVCEAVDTAMLTFWRACAMRESYARPVNLCACAVANSTV